MNIFKKFFLFLLVSIVLAGIASAQSLGAWLQNLPGNRLYLRSGVYFSYGTDTNTIVHSTVMRDVATGFIRFDNVVAKSTASVYTVQITTAALEAKTAIAQASLTQPVEWGRNLSLQFVVRKATNVIHCPFRIDGVDHMGNITYETIIATVGAVNYGNVAWIRVSTITPGALSIPASSLDIPAGTSDPLGASIILNVGIGDNIGFGVNISTSSDVYACKYAAGGTVPTSLTYDHTYDTWHDFTNAPNGTLDWIFYTRYNSSR